MGKPEWGIKRICHNCTTRYYDMMRDPISCPVCGTVYDPDAFLRSRRTRSSIAEEAVAAKAATTRRSSRQAPDPVEADGVEDSPVSEAETEEVGLETDETEDLETLDTGDTFTADDSADPALMEDASELGDDEDVGIDLGEGTEDER